MSESTCVVCGQRPGTVIPIVSVRAFVTGLWTRRDERPLCGPCARGPALRALCTTGLLGWWGWPGLARAGSAVAATTGGLARIGAWPRPLAWLFGAAAFLTPIAALILVLALLVSLGGGAQELVAEAERLTEEGRQLLTQGDAEGALSKFRAALDLTPQVPPLCYNAAVAAERAGRPAEAERRFRAAIRHLAPKQDHRYELGLGRVLLAGGSHAQAIEALQHAVALRGDLLPAHRSLQDALRGAGRAQAAEDRYAAWLRDHPESADAYYLFGRLNRSAPGRAALLRRGLQLDPKHFWCHLSLAATLLEEGKAGEALAHARSAVDDPRRSAKARLVLLRVELALGDRAGAEATLAALRTDFPGSRVLAEAERLCKAE